MGSVDLGGSGGSNKTPAKEKMIYMNLTTTIIIMNLLQDTDDVGKEIVKALKANISQSFTNKEIRKAACSGYGVNTARKMKKLKREQFDGLSKIFGESIWGSV